MGIESPGEGTMGPSLARLGGGGSQLGYLKS